MEQERNITVQNSQIQLILDKASDFIGSTLPYRSFQWTFSNHQGNFQHKFTEYIPGLMYILSKLLVSASQNWGNGGRITYLKVSIDRSVEEISVKTNGRTFPIQYDSHHQNLYTPETIFGIAKNIMFDSEAKGDVGPSLINVFSKRFAIECGDSRQKK